MKKILHRDLSTNNLIENCNKDYKNFYKKK